MAFIIILHFTFFLLAFGANLLAIYLLIKHFNRTKDFWSIFKPILLYEFAVFCFFTIKISPVLLYHYLGLLLFPLYLLILVVGLFLVFQYIMQKFSLLDLKKSLLIFLLMFFIITPFISFSRVAVEFIIFKNFPRPWQDYKSYKIENPQALSLPRPPYASPYGLLLGELAEKTDGLNDIFLERKFLMSLNRFFGIHLENL